MTTLSLLALLALVQPQDTLRLSDLQDLAVERDPRSSQTELEERASRLRREGLGSARLPQFQLRSDASYQSEVTEIPVELPGVTVGRPPKDRYEAALNATWVVWDGGRIAAQQDLERTRLALSMSGLDAELYQVRVEVSEAYFGALLLQEALAETETLIEDLRSRQAEVRDRVASGAALPGDTALIGAELLRAAQQRDALGANHLAKLDQLAHLSGRPIAASDVLAVPDLSARVSALSSLLAGPAALPEDLRVHPRFDVFDAERQQLASEAGVLDSGGLPQLQAFGDLLYGSPGFQQFTEDLHDYWRTGVRLQWAPWDWGKRSRDREVLRLRATVVDTREDAFQEEIVRAVQLPLRSVEQLQAALLSDEAIITLREQVVRQARAQFEERAIPASIYTRARTDLNEARIARLRHRAELARAQARALMTLGLELR